MLNIAYQSNYPNEILITRDQYRASHIKIIGDIESHIFLAEIKLYLDYLARENQNKQNEINMALWIHLTTPHLNLVSQLCDIGFDIHHGVLRQITLYKWISRTKNLIPPFTLFYIGAGAVLIKDQCIFLVQEGIGPKKGKYNIPCGRADPGETIKHCVERELLEETNIIAKFKGILQFREMSYNVYDCVDVFFVCLMEYENNAFDNIRLCKLQITDYKWVPLKDYLDFLKERNATVTQLKVGQYITKLWKQGFNFEKGILPLSTLNSEVMGQGKLDKYSAYHQLIHVPQTKD